MTYMTLQVLTMVSTMTSLQGYDIIQTDDSNFNLRTDLL